MDVLASGQHPRVPDGITTRTRLGVLAVKGLSESTELIVLHHLPEQLAQHTDRGSASGHHQLQQQQQQQQHKICTDVNTAVATADEG
jgi:hypothetical protein